MNKKKYSLSIVSYLNTLPFQYGIKNSAISNQIDLQLDNPAVCAQKLKQKEVDIGLVPVALLPELDTYHIVSDYCIGAVGNVDSVKLYSPVPLSSVTKILLDYQSKTSVSLVQVLAKHFWKISPEFIKANAGYEENTEPTTALVIIGDRTFSKNGSFAYEYDLSGEWMKYTGLPFVFATWVSLVPVEQNFVTEFNAALRFGTEHILESLVDYQSPVKHFDAYDYLKNKINYQFDHHKQKSLSLFLGYFPL